MCDPQRVMDEWFAQSLVWAIKDAERFALFAVVAVDLAVVAVVAVDLAVVAVVAVDLFDVVVDLFDVAVDLAVVAVAAVVELVDVGADELISDLLGIPCLPLWISFTTGVELCNMVKVRYEVRSRGAMCEVDVRDPSSRCNTRGRGAMCEDGLRFEVRGSRFKLEVQARGARCEDRDRGSRLRFEVRGAICEVDV